MNREDFKIRLLRADEIEVRVGHITENGVVLLLYKDARCDAAMLDEICGPFDWKKEYSRDNKNCTVSIWDSEKQMWISRENVGTESNTEKEKGLASDAFKRACFDWGFGRELYSSPFMFVSKEKLRHYKYDGNKKQCNDSFYVDSIKYDEDTRKILSVVIGIRDKGKTVERQMFSNVSSNTKEDVKPEPPKLTQSQPSTTQTPPVNKPAPPQAAPTNQAPVQQPVDSGPQELFSKDEIILIGTCVNGKYGEMKNTSSFHSFLAWVLKNPNRNYAEPKKQDQFVRFKKLAEKLQSEGKI